MRPIRLPRWTAPILLAFLAPACSEVGNRPVVKIGNDVITLAELRRETADLPPGTRPSLATRAERVAFVEDMIRRRLLLDHARRQADREGAVLAEVASADSAAEHWNVRDKEDIVLRRLQAIEGGMGDPTEAELQEAMEKAPLRFRLRRILFADLETAKQTVAQWKPGALPDSPGKGERYRLLNQEERDWVSWPIDSAVDAVLALNPGEFSPPLVIDGQVQVVQLLERSAGDSVNVSQSGIAEGIRRRKRALAFEALEDRLAEQARVTYDAEATNLLAERIRDAILRGTPENDFGFALPTLSAEEGARVLASWSARKGAPSQLTVEDVVEAIRHMNPARRPMRGPLAGQVQRVAEAEVNRRLLLEEASRRMIEEDWWAERQLRRLEEERLVRLAKRRIEDEASFSQSTIDSLTTLLLAQRPFLLQEAMRARVVRIDSPSRESALEERALILAAGGSLARYAQILDGRTLSSASYHFLSLTPGGVGSPELERAIFQGPAGGVQGPFLFGQTWILFETIGLDPQHPRAPQEVRDEVSQSFREGQGAAVVETWVQSKRKEVGVTIHEDVLDHLGPGA